MKNILIVNEIIKYESNFNGFLLGGYNRNIQEFKNDLIYTIDNEGAGEILEYYKNELSGSNDTNSTKGKRKELSDLVLILEGFAY